MPVRYPGTAVPDSVGRLTSLNWLDLGHNRLTAVPDRIGQLTDSLIRATVPGARM
jgi:Leucine-rich repeat (LRR) protein